MLISDHKKENYFGGQGRGRVSTTDNNRRMEGQTYFSRKILYTLDTLQINYFSFFKSMDDLEVWVIADAQSYTYFSK